MMEPIVIESILSRVEIARNDLGNVDGCDFAQIIGQATEQYDEVERQVYRLYDERQGDQESFEIIIVELEKWSCGLRDLIEKVHTDADVQRVGKLQSNTVITLSLEENKSLKVKKDKRMKELKLKINKLIIKLEELIISIQEQIEISSSNCDYIESVNNENSHSFEDIETRYNAAIKAEQQQGQRDEYRSNMSSQDSNDNNQEINKEEEKDKENERKFSKTVEEYKDKEIDGYKQDHSSKIYLQPQVDNIERKTVEKPGKTLEENVEITKTQRETLSTRLNEEQTDPLNWTRYKYFIKDGEFVDVDLGCIISSYKGSLKEKDYIMIMLKGIDDLPASLDTTYEVLSNIIQIEPVGLEVEFDYDCPWKISIPYLMMRNTSKEVVIICHDMTTGRLTNLETQELIFDDNKEGGFKLAEATLPSPSCMCVVVSKRKIEKFSTDKRGTKFVSSIDPRVVLTMSQHSVKIKVNFEMSVLQIESGQMNELLSKISTNNLYSMSPIVDIKSDYSRNFLKTASLQIPIPNIQTHSSRSRAVSARPQSMDKTIKRSKSAITRQISTDEDPVIKVAIYNCQENMWRTNNNLTFATNKNQDCVEIDVGNLSKQRFVVIRCDENFSDDQLNKSIGIINKGMETRTIQVIVRQHDSDPRRIVVVTANPNRMDKVQKYLTQESFGEDSSILSPEFVVCERSKLRIGCKGNLEIEDVNEVTYRYNSQLPNRKEFYVKEVDKFAQKSKESFQGFLVITEVIPSKSNKLWEAVINIPKTEIGNKKEIKDINEFNFQPTDIINKPYLHFLSQQLGKDWMALGKSLKVAELTIRRISSNPFIDTQTMAYECLLKWIKNATVYSKKMNIMEKALRSIGRFDLAQDLTQRVFIGK